MHPHTCKVQPKATSTPSHDGHTASANGCSYVTGLLADGPSIRPSLPSFFFRSRGPTIGRPFMISPIAVQPLPTHGAATAFIISSFQRFRLPATTHHAQLVPTRRQARPVRPASNTHCPTLALEPPLRRKSSPRPSPPPRPPPPPNRQRDMPWINRLLCSRSITIPFIILSALFYTVCLCLVARSIATSPVLQPPERILLLALAVLLPDFRHVVKSYSDAADSLYAYRPPFPTFRFPNASQPQPTNQHQVQTPQPQHPFVNLPRVQPPPWLADRLDEFSNRVSNEARKWDSLWGNVTETMSRPIMETGTQIRQMTSGTDLTLRKNVVIATVAVCLSFIGYAIAIVAGEVHVAGVTTMLANLIPNALLPRPIGSNRHEMLRLLHDVRIIVSLVATIFCAVSVIFPLAASYGFLICCFALVVTRYHFF